MQGTRLTPVAAALAVLLLVPGRPASAQTFPSIDSARPCCTVGAAGVTALCSGCSQPPVVEEPDPCNVQVVTLRLFGDDYINPNETENPRSVVVRLYQLANDLFGIPNTAHIRLNNLIDLRRIDINM